MYADFFISGRVSKIKRAVFVQKSTLRTNETGRNVPLKFRGVWLSPVFGFRYSNRQCPVIVCQHTWSPLALAPLFCSQNIGEIFHRIRHWLRLDFLEKNPSGLQNVDFQIHIASHSFVRSQQVLQNILIVCCLWFPKKSLQILLKDNHAFLSVSFRSSSNGLSCLSSLIWGPIYTPSLVFGSLTFRNLFLKYSNPRPVLSIPFIKVLHEAQIFV